MAWPPRFPRRNNETSDGTNEYGEGRETEAVEAWLEQYPDVVAVDNS